MAPPREPSAAEQARAEAAAQADRERRRAALARAAERAAARRQARQQAQAVSTRAETSGSAVETRAASTPSASAEDIGAYARGVVGRIAAMRSYPESARARGAQGTVVVGFSIGAAGQVLAVGVRRSSGDAELDRDAVATVRRAGPFGPPPAGSPRTFNAPLHYQM